MIENYPKDYPNSGEKTAELGIYRIRDSSVKTHKTKATGNLQFLGLHFYYEIVVGLFRTLRVTYLHNIAPVILVIQVFNHTFLF